MLDDRTYPRRMACRELLDGSALTMTERAEQEEYARLGKLLKSVNLVRTMNPRP